MSENKSLQNNIEGGLELSADVLELLPKNLMNNLATEMLRLKRFDTFEKLLKHLDLSWGAPYSYSFYKTENSFCSVISYAPIELVEKVLPSFLVANQVQIASESFKGFELGKALSIVFCNAIDLKEQSDSAYESVKQKILKLINIDNKEGLFSFEKKFSFNENKYFPIPYKNSYYSELALTSFVFALNDDEVSYEFFSSKRMQEPLSKMLKDSANSSMLTNLSFWQTYPLATRILFNQVIKNTKSASEIKNIYDVPISSNVLSFFLFNKEPLLRNTCIPSLLQYIPHALNVSSFSDKLSTFNQALTFYKTDLTFGKEVFVEILKKIVSKEFGEEERGKFFVQQVLFSGTPGLVYILEELYKDFLLKKQANVELNKKADNGDVMSHSQSSSQEVKDLYEMVFSSISAEKKVGFIKGFFRIPRVDWGRSVRAVGGAKGLIGFNAERNGLDESFLMLALSHGGIDGFKFAVDIFKSEGLLQEALNEKAWVLSGSTRKKGDVLAYCVAQGSQEAVDYIYEVFPEIKSKSAKETVKKMLESNIRESEVQRAQSAFDMLTLKQNLLNTGVASSPSSDINDVEPKLETKNTNIFKRML